MLNEGKESWVLSNPSLSQEKNISEKNTFFFAGKVKFRSKERSLLHENWNYVW